MKFISLIISFTFSFLLKTYSQNFFFNKNESGAFPIVSKVATVIYTDENDDWLIQKSASLFQNDIEKVSGKKPEIIHTISPKTTNVIIIGSTEKSKLIQQLIQSKKLNIDSIKNKWEAYQIQTINKPLSGVEQALIIAGSDKRGTAFGVLEMSKQIGVSPWYWWADVPVKEKKEIFFQKKVCLRDRPLVKYRGIFINDEAPAFSGWAHEKFGGFNHHVYEKVFELLLRLKANYLWPAMWGNAFNDDDTLNPILANKYGIVIGTSHHEPMLRSQQEWKRYGKGAWDYTTNESELKSFWKKGIENMDSHESIVTIGMRGDGDEPMTEGTAIKLLEKIVIDQRKIIEKITQKPASETAQLWALYKEVQDYYDKGMRVPDDVTLLLCDDNWGNLRRLPPDSYRDTDKPRSGGYGIYYHFDYVGGPRNYKWINTNNIARVWEQMHLAYEYGVNKIWIVNVGDLKPMEFPISFFLDYAWNPEKITVNDLPNYFTKWAAQQFGEKYAREIGEIIQKYSQYNARRKPELLSSETYSLTHYNEFERVVDEFDKLAERAQKINNLLAPEYKDAYYELVLHPIIASANLNAMYLAAAKNKFYAKLKTIEANLYADSVKSFYRKDSLISYKYNHEIAGGKWNHMMDQTHIGYSYWQQPEVNKMPDVIYVTKDSMRDVQVVRGTPILLKEKDLKNNIHYELNGYISIEAANYSKAINTSKIEWKIIPGIGRDGDGITVFPVTAPDQEIKAGSPHLEYQIYCYDTGTIKIDAYFSPALNFHNNDGLKYGISIDNERPQIISINHGDNDLKTWESWVANNIIIKNTEHKISKAGKHVVKFWMVSSAVILQKLILDFGGVKQSYLGPLETKIK